MDNPDYSTERRKGQHLTNEERHNIEVHLKDGWSIYQIAKDLNRPYNTVKNEIARGTVLLYSGKVKRYQSSAGYAVYLQHRLSCRKQYHRLAVSDFIRYVEKNFHDNGWSLDACAGRAIADGEFSRDRTVCTKTLYNYVDMRLLNIKNIDLPEKLRRNTKPKKVRENKRILGTSIEERPEIIKNRLEFGHWEIDTVVGSKNENEPVVLTLVERKTRYCIWVIAENHTSNAIQKAIGEVLDYFGNNADKVF
jgi:IS30 family transposase